MVSDLTLHFLNREISITITDILVALGLFRSESLSTTLTRSEVTEKVKIRTRRDATLEILLLQDSTSNLQNRSVCPWTYRVRTDSNRQPADLVEAVCSTSGVQGSANVCETIFYYVPIKTKQTSSSGVVTWADDYVKWSVGCTLAQPRTVVAVPPSQSEEPTMS